MESRRAGVFPPRSQCEFREANARCVFVDGHPSCHICVRPHGSNVPIRGAGGLPDPAYIWRSDAPAAISKSAGRAGEDVRGFWDDGMIRALVAEIAAAGAEPPRDWIANLPRLREESARHAAK
jgi:hypothetical protein